MNNQDVSTATSNKSARNQMFSSTFLMHISAELIMLGITVVYFSFKHAKMKNQMLKLSNRLDKQNQEIEMLKLAIIQIQNEKNTRQYPPPVQRQKAPQTQPASVQQQRAPPTQPAPVQQQRAPPTQRVPQAVPKRVIQPRRVVTPRIVVRQVNVPPPSKQTAPKIEELKEDELEELNAAPSDVNLDDMLKSELAELNEESKDDLD
jgi:hypothetical protein